MLREQVVGTASARFEVILRQEEMARFTSFLEVRGAKKGPFTRQLILRAMEEDVKTLGGLRGGR